MGVGAACNNFPVACYLKFLQHGGCNKCCKLNGFVRGECRGTGVAGVGLLVLQRIDLLWPNIYLLV
ncbi:hypothetical protein HU200_016089 [Digitaria exilis]|uniref:Uncharacterized protein n=1 Tax=Digitaria exilis TaxID=1010633 RepID=A0A835F980_9POAL|nr:hypothetical protein HU200_016089 [Digitaria exilis]